MLPPNKDIIFCAWFAVIIIKYNSWETNSSPIGLIYDLDFDSCFGKYTLPSHFAGVRSQDPARKAKIHE